MKTLTLKTEELIDQLLAVLDTDIQHLEDSIATLDQLRALVIKQNNDGLNQLLSSIQSKTKNSRENEYKRQGLRKELALTIGCNVKQITLSRFETELTGDRKFQVTQRKTKLRTLAGLLKKESANTQRLLADCGRFNRLMLKSIFDLGRSESPTYNADGATQRQTNTVFMNVQF